MPFRNSARLAAGLGVLARVNVVLLPSIVPPGTSASEKSGLAPPQAPDVPSTNTQSEGLPITASIPPAELIIAARPTLKPVPFIGRKLKSFVSPVTALSAMGV